MIQPGDTGTETVTLYHGKQSCNSCSLGFPGALARSKQLRRQEQQHSEAVAAAEHSEHAAITAATAGQKAAAARMKQKMTELSPTKGQLQHIIQLDDYLSML